MLQARSSMQGRTTVNRTPLKEGTCTLMGACAALAVLGLFTMICARFAINTVHKNIYVIVLRSSFIKQSHDIVGRASIL